MTSNVNGTPFEEEPMTALVVPLGRPWTAEDVSRLPEDLHYELLDGRLVVPPAPLPIHQTISLRIISALSANSPDDVVITFDQSVLVDNHSEPRPDVVVTRIEGANRTPVFAADGTYRKLAETNELITLDLPWRVTLDVPAWTRMRDHYREKGVIG